MKRRKAFTLIEIAAVISISLLLLGLGGISYKFCNVYKINNMEREFLNELYKLLNKGRDLCIENELKGEINLTAKTKTIIFDLNRKEKIRIDVPEEIEFIYQPTTIDIKSNGDIQACTLKWKGKKSGNEYKITVQVGISTIRVYKNGKIEEG